MPPYGGEQPPDFPPAPLGDGDGPDPRQPPRNPNRTRNIVLGIVGGVVALLVAGVVIGVIAGRGTPAASSSVPNSPQIDPNGETCKTLKADGYCPGDAAPSPSPSAAPSPTPSPTPSPKPPPPPPPPPPTYNPVTDSQWQLISENPNAYIGQTFTVYGTIFQHDANTGADEFLADAGPSDNPNTVTVFTTTSDASQVAPLQENQSFTAEVSVEGSLSYTTESGGSNTAPELTVVSITVTG
jgi:hypothetical protein